MQKIQMKKQQKANQKIPQRKKTEGSGSIKKY